MLRMERLKNLTEILDLRVEYEANLTEILLRWVELEIIHMDCEANLT